MNATRLNISILFLFTFVLWVFEDVFVIYTVMLPPPSYHLYISWIIVTVGNVLGIVAALVLGISAKMRRPTQIRGKFELVTGTLFLGSAVVLSIPYAELLRQTLEFGEVPPVEVIGITLALAGALTYLAASILILSSAKTLRSLSLPRLEGISFGLLFLIGAIVCLAGYFAVAGGGLAQFAAPSTLLQISAMITYLYPYARSK